MLLGSTLQRPVLRSSQSRSLTPRILAFNGQAAGQSQPKRPISQALPWLLQAIALSKVQSAARAQNKAALTAAASPVVSSSPVSSPASSSSAPPSLTLEPSTLQPAPQPATSDAIDLLSSLRTGGPAYNNLERSALLAISEGAILVEEQRSLQLLKVKLQEEIKARAEQAKDVPDPGRDFCAVFCESDGAVRALESTLMDAVKEHARAFSSSPASAQLVDTVMGVGSLPASTWEAEVSRLRVAVSAEIQDIAYMYARLASLRHVPQRAAVRQVTDGMSALLGPRAAALHQRSVALAARV